ncbi:MAG TPA: hypothetical protein VFW98_04625 [Gemmatimonadaceae bacterium]|nr:hypothetical protein [Gemmatimonadaceae bacterium]
MPTVQEVIAATEKPLPRALTLLCLVLALIGLAVFIIGIAVGQDRVWQALLWNWLFFATVSQAGITVVAVMRIATARWSRPIARMLEGYAAFLPVAFLLLILIFIGRSHVFPWAQYTPTAAEKREYLNGSFLVTRDLVLFAVLTWLSLWIVYKSVRLDVAMLPESGAAWARGLRDRMRRSFGDERREIFRTHTVQGRLAVVIALCYGFFFSVFSWDLSMSLDTHFQSTMYGWWFFMGAWLGAISTWGLIVVCWRKFLGARHLITEHHFHDLGKFTFAFTAFWGYLTFAQYLVIWYGNMGEETHWFHLRLIAPWMPLTLAVVFLLFVFPFFGLLARAAKVFLPTFITFCTCSALGLWLLRYIEVYPSLHYRATDTPFGVWEIGITLGYLGIWGLCYIAFMNAFPRMRVTMMTSPFRDEVQVPYDPETLEPLPAHE